MPYNCMKYNDMRMIFPIAPSLFQEKFIFTLADKGEFCYNAFTLKRSVLRVVSGRVACLADDAEEVF